MKVKVSVRPPSLTHPHYEPVNDFYVDILNNLSSPNALANELDDIKSSIVESSMRQGVNKFHMAFTNIPDYIGYDVCVILITKA